MRIKLTFLGLCVVEQLPGHFYRILVFIRLDTIGDKAPAILVRESGTIARVALRRTFTKPRQERDLYHIIAIAVAHDENRCISPVRVKAPPPAE